MQDYNFTKSFAEVIINKTLRPTLRHRPTRNKSQEVGLVSAHRKIHLSRKLQTSPVHLKDDEQKKLKRLLKRQHHSKPVESVYSESDWCPSNGNGGPA